VRYVYAVALVFFIGCRSAHRLTDGQSSEEQQRVCIQMVGADCTPN
jgi:hypothetical protein